jgi:3-keto-disaccharide hydrolase
MKGWTHVLVGFGVATLCAGALRANAEGFAPLFDGKSLDGWKRFGGQTEVWGVEEGMLVCQGRGGGWLGTDKPYSDFVLRLEFRMSPGSNSGVYLRAPADTSHISRTGMEIQLLDETHPDFKNVKPWQLTGAIYHVAAPKPGHLKPTGQWNSMEIEAQGPHVVVRLNDATVVDDRLDAHSDLEAEHTGLKRKDGLIGLQSHNGRVAFRNIEIKTLPKSP